MTPAPGRRIRQAGALGLAVTLVGWSGLVDPRLPPLWRPMARAALGAGLVAATRAALGLRPPPLCRGLRLPLVISTGVALGAAAATALPAVRSAMAARDLPAAPLWLGWQIPASVWSEEAAYRAVLGSVAADAFGAGGGRLLQAAAFGLSHVADARGAEETVVGTVLVTGAAGWLLAWLQDHTGSLGAPMLVHLAVNEAGAVAALLVQRRDMRRTS